MSTSTEEVKISKESSNQPDNDYVKWRKAKKVAVMASFVGKDYLGMQRYELHMNLQFCLSWLVTDKSVSEALIFVLTFKIVHNMF